MDLSSLYEFTRSPAALWICTAAVIAVWIGTFRTAWKHAHHHTIALVIATVYCLVSEFFAIRLGKYHYAAFPLSIPEFDLPGLERALSWLSGKGWIPEILHVNASKHLPLEIALLEGALLYSVFRLTNLLSPLHTTTKLSFSTIIPWLHERWANPVFNAFVALSLDSMLDPVVSGTMSLDGSGETVPGLALWTWHTNSHYAGHWFGVPLANYNAWFAALFAFTIATRVGPQHVSVGGSKLQRGKATIWAGARSLFVLTLLLFAVKFSLDYVTYEVFLPPPDYVAPRWWQFAVSLTLVGAGVAAAVRIIRRAVREATFEVGTVAPLVFVFAYSAGALFLSDKVPHREWLIPLWGITVIIAAVHAASPWRFRRHAVRPAAGPEVVA